MAKDAKILCPLMGSECIEDGAIKDCGANYQSAVLSAQSTTTATMIGDGTLGAGGGYNFIATGI
jgi:hypothetical protein